MRFKLWFKSFQVLHPLVRVTGFFSLEYWEGAPEWLGKFYAKNGFKVTDWSCSWMWWCTISIQLSSWVWLGCGMLAERWPVEAQRLCKMHLPSCVEKMNEKIKILFDWIHPYTYSNSGMISQAFIRSKYSDRLHNYYGFLRKSLSSMFGKEMKYYAWIIIELRCFWTAIDSNFHLDKRSRWLRWHRAIFE